MIRSLVVIPTYNEKENIRPLVEAVLQKTPAEIEILVVDDGSPDGTGQEADKLSAAHPRVHVMHRKGKQGLGTAYVQGFRWGMDKGFEALIEMDADFSHRPDYLTVMLKGLETSDVVIGSRYVPGGGTVNWGLVRRVLSLGGSLYSRMILGAPIRDFTGGFNGWRRAALEAVNLSTLRSDGYSFQIELKYRAFRKGFKIQEFPIVFEDRKVGQSKMSSKIVVEALFRVWRFRFQ